jgi:hypothetical protein
MNKKNSRTANGTTKYQPPYAITQSSNEATKLELVAFHLMENDTAGTSHLSAMAKLHDLSPRNSISQLRRQYRIRIMDQFFAHKHSAGGKTYFKRYWLADRDEARKISEILHLKRKRRRAEPISQARIARYLATFPITLVQQPAI